MNWFLNVGCGSMYPPVVHNCTAIEFDQQNQCIVRIKPFVWLINIWFVFGHGSIHGLTPT